MIGASVSLAAMALLLASCAETETKHTQNDSECRGFELGGRLYSMRVPKGASIEPDSARGSVMIRPNAHGRLVRFLSVAPLAGATIPPPTDSTTLANGMTLSYSLDEDSGGGSGGPEVELIGETLLDPKTPLMIVCHDQQEGGANAEWCLEPLGTLAPEASPKACR